MHRIKEFKNAQAVAVTTSPQAITRDGCPRIGGLWVCADNGNTSPVHLASAASTDLKNRLVTLDAGDAAFLPIPGSSAQTVAAYTESGSANLAVHEFE